jgi:hypothetical protein
MDYFEMLAEAMYAERVAERGPAWRDLGDVTRAVWIERAMAEYMASLA